MIDATPDCSESKGRKIYQRQKSVNLFSNDYQQNSEPYKRTKVIVDQSSFQQSGFAGASSNVANNCSPAFLNARFHQASENKNQSNYIKYQQSNIFNNKATQYTGMLG